MAESTIKVPDLKERPTGRSFRVGGAMADDAGPKRYPFVVPRINDADGFVLYPEGNFSAIDLLTGITAEGVVEPIPATDCEVYGLDEAYEGPQAITAVYDGRACDMIVALQPSPT